MAVNPATELRKIRAADLSKWALTFWIVKQSKNDRVATYRVMRVNTDLKLKKRLRGYVRTQLQTRDFHLAEYEFSTADTDDVLLTMDADATDFEKVESAITKVRKSTDGFDHARVTKREQLLNSWAYVLEFELGKDRLYAWKKIHSLTQPKTVSSTKPTIFHEEKLVDINDDEVFLIDPGFDFFVYGGTTFIAHKKQFEIAMNFREGMKVHRDEVLADFENLSILKNIDVLRNYVGDNLNHLRKLASIRKSGYYKQQNYIDQLIKVNAELNWGLKIENKQLVVESETVALLLTLLNNDRLQSPINDEFFDAAAKSKVGA